MLTPLHAGNFFTFVVCYFFKINLFNKFYQEHYHSVNPLDPDQAGHSVRPELGLNCLHFRLPADDTSRQRFNIGS